MSLHRYTASKTPIAFWEVLECFSIQSPDRPRPWDRQRPVYAHRIDQPFPWQEESEHARKRPGQDFVWRYHVQAGIFPVTHIYRQAYEKLGVDPKELENLSSPGSGRIFDYDCDSQGRLLPETFSVSLAAYAFSTLLRQGLEGVSAAAGGFEALEDSLRVQFAANAGAICSKPDRALVASWKAPKDRRPWSGDQLGLFATHILESFGAKPELFFGEELPFSVIVSARQVPIRYAPADSYQFTLKGGGDEEENPPEAGDSTAGDEGVINSFFLNDLAMVEKQASDWGAALSHAVFAIADKENDNTSPPKIDVRSPAAQIPLQRLLDPEQFPVGRWPAEYPLAKAQQLAINAAYARLQPEAGLFAVNGPPGTGKTTLLRDLFAAVITDRARFLASLQKPEHAFLPTRTVRDPSGEILYTLHSMRKEFSDFTILVASSNNGAVENISQEIPLRNALGERYQQRGAVPNYFAEAATMFLEEPAWAWLAVPLGNLKNRNKLARWLYGVRWDPKKHPPKIPASLVTDRFYGIRPWLQERQLTAAEAAKAWQTARSDFAKALALEARCRARLQAHAEVFRDRTATEQSYQDLRKQLHEQAQKRLTLRRQIREKTSQRARVDADRTKEEMAAAEQSVLALFHSPVTQYRKNQKLEKYRAEIAAMDDEIASIQKQMDSCSEAMAAFWQKTRTLRSALQAQEIPGQWTNAFTAETENERELAAPWFDEDWLSARTQVFLRAVHLHRTFLLATSKYWLENVRTLAAWLRGGVDDAPDSYFRTLSLLFPVLSSTFAAMQKFLPGMAKESIGWLCIDEAGQATPQAAVGALYRSKRAIVVGDPLQLPPIPPVPAGLEHQIAQKLEIPPYWWPSHVSAQILADQATPIGTWLPLAVDSSPIEHEGKIWVGAPLRVHRRCLDPMFSISNQLAYDGLMVQGRGEQHAHPGFTHLPESQWIPMHGKAQSGHWIPAEGEALRDLLTQIRSTSVHLQDVFLISPFRDVVRELRKIAKDFRMDPAKVGTIHTTQGKEAPIVILVLGGRSGHARDWAAASPNLLNVAASRAKERFYLIGDRADWSIRGVFSVAHKFLA